MLLLFSDFGSGDPYLGQVKMAILAHAPGAMLVDVLHDAPDFGVVPSAHLLAALAPGFPVGSVCFAVVDPGVGSTRGAVVIRAEGRWFVGPDNGLLSVIAARASQVELWRIRWRPDALSDSFHGRDLFAPMAAWIDADRVPEGALTSVAHLDVDLGPEGLAEIIYVDHYGNAMTGLPGREYPRATRFSLRGREVGYARVFSAVPVGAAFWYENSIGLVEVALNGGSAARALGLAVGDVLVPISAR